MKRASGRTACGRWIAIASVLAGLCVMPASVPAMAAPGGNPAGARPGSGRVLQRDADLVHAAGVSGVVAQADTGQGEKTARSGVGNRETGSPMPRNGYIRIGSATKTFTATVVLQLAGEGRLSLDDTISRWLPAVVSGNGNDGGKITVRELLQHTSGLYDYTADLAAEYDTPAKYYHNRMRAYTPRELVAMALRHRPSFAPGTQFSYSSTGYVLLGMLIQRVTGRTWEQEVRDRILRPLGMRHTFTPDETAFLPSPHAMLYQGFVPGGPFIDVTIPALALEMGADGSIISTPSDLNTFFRALLGGELLRHAQLAEMEQTVPEPDSSTIIPGTRYGLGLEWSPLACGGGYWEHSGDGLGYDVEDGVSAGARTSVVVYLGSLVFDRGPFIAQLKAADQLVADQLCGKR